MQISLMLNKMLLKRKKKKNYKHITEVFLLVKVTLGITITKLIDISTSSQHFHNNMRIEHGSLSPKMKWPMSKNKKNLKVAA